MSNEWESRLAAFERMFSNLLKKIESLPAPSPGAIGVKPLTASQLRAVDNIQQALQRLEGLVGATLSAIDQYAPDQQAVRQRFENLLKECHERYSACAGRRLEIDLARRDGPLSSSIRKGSPGDHHFRTT